MTQVNRSHYWKYQNAITQVIRTKWEVTKRHNPGENEKLLEISKRHDPGDQELLLEISKRHDLGEQDKVGGYKTP